LLSGAVTAYFTLHHQFMKGAACFAFHQLLDATDGTMARRFNMCSPFGAMLDATCDQISGALLTITGIYVGYDNSQPSLAISVLLVSLILLVAAMAYANRPRTIKYVEDLGYWQWFGLLEEENMTYITTALFCGLSFVCEVNK